MKFGFGYLLTLSLLLPQALASCSGDLKYWCSATQTCITLGQDSCPGISGQVFVGPGTLQRTTPPVSTATCHIITPTTCGADVLNSGYVYTIGPGFVVGEKCALSCVGYTMVKQQTTGTGTGPGTGTGVFASGGTAPTANNFGTKPNTQVSNSGYIKPVGQAGMYYANQKYGGGRRFLRGGNQIEESDAVAAD